MKTATDTIWSFPGGLTIRHRRGDRTAPVEIRNGNAYRAWTTRSTAAQVIRDYRAQARKETT